MKKKILFLGAIFIFSFILVGCTVKSPASKPSDTGRITAPPELELIDTILILKYDNNEDKYELEIEQGKTVFDLLKQASEENNFSLEYQNHNIGVFIKEIKGIKNGKDNKYWQYTVNSKYADKAADMWELKNDDIIEWKFIESQF